MDGEIGGEAASRRRGKGERRDVARPDRGEWLIVFLLLLSPVLGFGTRFPWSLLPWGSGRILWAAATLAFLALLCLAGPRAGIAQRLRPWLRGKAWLLALIVANLLFLLLNYYYFRPLGYGFPWPGIAACALALFVVPRYPLFGSLGLSVILLIASIACFPLVTVRSDMLPAVRLALDQWAAGGDPYGRLLVTSGTDRMPYLPGLFFSHLPAWLAGVDLRWNAVLYRVGWGLLLAHGLRRSPQDSPLRACALLLFLNPYLNFRHELYFDFYLLVIVAFWTLPAAATAVLALGLYTRQWTWVMAPFLWLATSGGSVRARAAGLLRLLAWTAIWGGVSWLLLQRSTSAENLQVVLTKFQALVGSPLYFGDYGLTLYPLVMTLGIAPASQLLQVGTAATLFVLSLWAKPERAAWLGLVALSVFVLLNALYWNYFAFELGLWILGWDIWRRHRDGPEGVSVEGANRTDGAG